MNFCDIDPLLAMSWFVRSFIPQGMVDKPESPAARFNFVSENEGGRERKGEARGGGREGPNDERGEGKSER